MTGQESVTNVLGNSEMTKLCTPDLSMTKINSWLLLNSDSSNWGKKFNINTSFRRTPSEHSTRCYFSWP